MGFMDIVRQIGTGMQQGSPIGWGLDIANVIQHKNLLGGNQGGGGGHPAAAQPQQQGGQPGTNPISHIAGDTRDARAMLMDAFKKYGVDPANPYSNVQGLAQMRAQDPFWFNQAVGGGPIQEGKQSLPGSGGGFVDPQTLQTMQILQTMQQQSKPLIDPQAMSTLMNQTVEPFLQQSQKSTQDAIGSIKGASPNVKTAAQGATGAGAQWAANAPEFQTLINAINQTYRQQQAMNSLFTSGGTQDILKNLINPQGSSSGGFGNLPPATPSR